MTKVTGVSPMNHKYTAVLFLAPSLNVRQLLPASYTVS